MRKVIIVDDDARVIVYSLYIFISFYICFIDMILYKQVLEETCASDDFDVDLCVIVFIICVCVGI